MYSFSRGALLQSAMFMRKINLFRNLFRNRGASRLNLKDGGFSRSVYGAG
jgi:hypothetical protein